MKEVWMSLYVMVSSKEESTFIGISVALYAPISLNSYCKAEKTIKHYICTALSGNVPANPVKYFGYTNKYITETSCERN